VTNVKRAQVRQLQSAADAVGLRIRLLGPMTVTIDGRPVAIAAKKARALLGYLALREGTEVARGVLTGLLWGERSEDQARASLRQTLSELKSALGEAAASSIRATKEAIAWVPGSAWIDARLVESAAGSTDEAALSEAAKLAGGELMEGLAFGEAGFEQWLAAERERFRLLACGIQARLMERSERDGRLEEALAHGLKLLSLDPLQEQVQRGLMRLYAAQGRHDAALAQYERVRHELSEQLGVLPQPETEELARSIRASRRAGPAAPRERASAASEPTRSQDPVLPDRPSIAVLPFQNLSADPEQEHFADGIAADLITQLSRLRDLLVIAHSSTAVFRGGASPVQDVARQLGVRYVLEGSVRRAGNRIRVTTQLIDAATGGPIWAERYDRELTDVFDLQDEITKAVTVALQVNLTEGDTARVAAEGTRNLQAWEAYLQGKAALLNFTKHDNVRARRFFEQAIHHDPSFGLALAELSNAHWLNARFRYTPDPRASLELAKTTLRQAEELVGETGAVLFQKGAIALMEGRHEEALEFHRRAVELSPSDAYCAAALGLTQIYVGDFAGAIASLKISLRLSPYGITWAIYYLTFAYIWLGDLERGRSHAALYLAREPQEPYAFMLAAIAESAASRPDAARDHIAALLARHPETTCAGFAHAQFYRDPERLRQLVGWLRDAGLPEGR
jgi:TolB-like protein/two-component SAPR family response regulator